MPQNPRPIPRPQNFREYRNPFTIEPFPSLSEMEKFFDGIPISSQNIPERSPNTYKSLYDSVTRDYTSIINGNGSVSNREWYGEPLISSVDEALARNRYQLMDDYQRAYEMYIKPNIQELLKDSRAQLEMPQMRYNDLQLGTFDFNRASQGLIPIYKYYSLKYKDFVDGNEVETIQKGEKFVYQLKSDASPVVVVPKLLTEDQALLYKIYKAVYDGEDIFELMRKYDVRIGGIESITSTIKKTFVLKEKVKKLKNAVRIFVKAGYDNTYRNKAAGYPEFKWDGYLACALAEALITLGYSVNIVGVTAIQYPTSNDNAINYNGKLVSGSRVIMTQLKQFEETLDKPSLLYVLSDATYFRIKFFVNIIKYGGKNIDKIDRALGYPNSINDIETMIYQKIGPRDKMWNQDGTLNSGSQFLYYFVGDVGSEQGMIQKFNEIVFDVINKNEEARQVFMNPNP